MDAKSIILISIIAAGILAIYLSYDFFKPRVKQLLPFDSLFSKITTLFVIIIFINLGQSLWIITERSHPSFPIPGDNYRIESRSFTDFNSLTKRIPTLYSIQNLYIAVDELTTEPIIYSINETFLTNSDNKSKFYGTVWPRGEVIITNAVTKQDITEVVRDKDPQASGTVYSTLKKTDPGIDWSIYTASNHANATQIIVLSEMINDRQTWTFVDVRLLGNDAKRELKK